MKTHLISAAAIFSTTVLLAGAAEARTHRPDPKLPARIKAMYRMAGNWHGSVTLEMGGKRIPMTASFSCKPASGGHAIFCRSTFTDPRGNKHKETDLFGYDPGANKYHWFAVSDSGETHDHVAAVPKGATMRWVYRGKSKGKSFVERVVMTYNRDSTVITLRNRTHLGGKLMMSMSGTVRKTTKVTRK